MPLPATFLFFPLSLSPWRVPFHPGGGLPARLPPHPLLRPFCPRSQAFAAALRGLQRISEAAAGFAALGDKLTSTLLRGLTTPDGAGGSGGGGGCGDASGAAAEGAGSGFPDLAGPLAGLQGATDWAEAEATGRVVPAPGVDAAYDAAEEAIARAEAELEEYLEVRVGCTSGRVRGDLGGAWCGAGGQEGYHGGG